jgi:FlaA1/EpsC-like NDP-sugar epimerase
VFWDLTSDALNPIPISVWIMGATFSIVAMGAVRFRSRLFSFNRLSARGGLPRVLVVGTDATAARFAREAMNGSAADIIGFVSHDGTPEARQIAGRPVFGGPLLIRDLVRDWEIEQLVIVAPSDVLVRSIVDMSLDNRVRLSVLPSFSDTLMDRHGIRDPRDLQVEDMLPRPQVDTHLESVRDSIDGRRVLITGAGGSIGSEILRQVLRFDPALVIALDHDETHLHDALIGIGGDDRVVMSLCDIRDKRRVDAIFDTWRPDVVFHAAAHKHVPILQDNPDEAVKTNVLGTANVIDACHTFFADRFVLISTDKAVAPANVMGATKRFAEIMTQAAQHRQSGCVFTAVRFGNVLGSRGSVVPTFVNQIKNGGPVTITDPEMTRFFMTIGEAVQLVLQAGAIASGGEIHVLDMGQPVKILDLAHRMIRMAGLVPGEDIAIEIIGRRPGEKLTEELAIDPLEDSAHHRISIAHPRLPGGPATVHTRIEALRYCVEQSDILSMMDIVNDVVTADGTEEVVDLTASIPAAEWS